MKRSVRAWFSHKENLALVIIIGLAVFKLVIHQLTSSTYALRKQPSYFPLPWNQNIHRAGLAADQVLSMNTISIDR